MEPQVLVALGGVALLAVWALANIRHVRRRQRKDSEWRAATSRPDLWTSAARCRSCGSSGGVLELEGDRLWLVCLACGERQEREHRG